MEETDVLYEPYSALLHMQIFCACSIPVDINSMKVICMLNRY